MRIAHGRRSPLSQEEIDLAESQAQDAEAERAYERMLAGDDGGGKEAKKEPDQDDEIIF